MVNELILVQKIGLPLGKASANCFLAERAERAEKVICARMSRGKLSELADSKKASALFRYLRAALEGAARVNLDLLAQVIAGRERGDERTFALSDFTRWSRALSELTREEVIVLGRVVVAVPAVEAEIDKTTHRSYRLEARLTNDLVGEGKLFDRVDQLRATLSALQRHGLFLQVSLWDVNPYDPSPLFDQLARLVDFDDALARYGAADDEDDAA